MIREELIGWAEEAKTLWNKANHVMYDDATYDQLIKLVTERCLSERTPPFTVNTTPVSLQICQKVAETPLKGSMAASRTSRLRQLIKSTPQWGGGYTLIQAGKEVYLGFNFPDRQILKDISYAQLKSELKSDSDVWSELRAAFLKLRTFRVIPEREVEKVVTFAYTNPSMGAYRGTKTIFAMFAESFLGVKRDRIEQVLLKQEVKQLTQGHAVVRQPIVSVYPNELWQMDVFSLNDVRVSNTSDFKGIFRKDVVVFIDHFSKFAWTAVVNEKKSDTAYNRADTREFARHKQIANKLDEIVASLIREGMGAPNVLQSDNEFNFDQGENPVQESCIKNGIQQRFSLKYSPTTQGLVERFNRTLKTCIKKWIYATYTDLDAYRNDSTFEYHLQRFTDSYNGSYHTVIKATPHEIYFGKKNATRVDSIFNQVCNMIDEPGLQGGNVDIMNCPVQSTEEQRIQNLNPTGQNNKWKFGESKLQKIAVERARDGIRSQADVMLRRAEKLADDAQKGELKVGSVVRIYRAHSEFEGTQVRRFQTGLISNRAKEQDQQAKTSNLKAVWSKDIYRVTAVLITGQDRSKEPLSCENFNNEEGGYLNKLCDRGPLKYKCVKPETKCTNPEGAEFADPERPRPKNPKYRLAARYKLSKIEMNLDGIRTEASGDNVRITIPPDVQGAPLRWCYYRKDLLLLPTSDKSGEVVLFKSITIGKHQGERFVLKLLDNLESRKFTRQNFQLQQLDDDVLKLLRAFFNSTPLTYERKLMKNIKIVGEARQRETAAAAGKRNVEYFLKFELDSDQGGGGDRTSVPLLEYLEKNQKVFAMIREYFEAEKEPPKADANEES
jgi:transposase InsO family protein